MPQEYENLVKALQETGIPFAEYGWSPSPESDYGIVSLEFEPDSLDGDDRKLIRAWEGSVDVYFRDIRRRSALAELIEDVLKDKCDASWRAESFQHESNTGLFHKEWVFQIEE